MNQTNAPIERRLLGFVQAYSKAVEDAKNGVETSLSNRVKNHHMGNLVYYWAADLCILDSIKPLWQHKIRVWAHMNNRPLEHPFNESASAATQERMDGKLHENELHNQFVEWLKGALG